MSNVKERLLGAITVMDETSAARLWEFVLEMTNNVWDTMGVVAPYKIDLKIIN